MQMCQTDLIQAQALLATYSVDFRHRTFASWAEMSRDYDELARTMPGYQPRFLLLRNITNQAANLAAKYPTKEFTL